jgi:hypothetical protein
VAFGLDARLPGHLEIDRNAKSRRVVGETLYPDQPLDTSAPAD